MVMIRMENGRLLSYRDGSLLDGDELFALLVDSVDLLAFDIGLPTRQSCRRNVEFDRRWHEWLFMRVGFFDGSERIHDLEG